MRRLHLPMSIAAALVAGAIALLPLAVSAQSSPATTTPEDAVGAYVEAIAANDMEAVLAATATDEMAAGFDFQAFTERLQAMMLVNGLAPAEYPMFAAIDRYQLASQILGQVRNLTYGLLSDEVVDGSLIAPVDTERIAAFVAAVDPSRLAGLAVVDIRLPEPEVMASERYLDNVAQLAAAYGADEMTERLALVDLDGTTYGLGFTLLRYGDQWLVSSQSSAIGGTSALGTAEPMTRAAFDERTGG
jgi:hypothetical protein